MVEKNVRIEQLEEEFKQMKAGFAEMKAENAEMKTELAEVKAELAEMKATQEDTRDALDANVMAIYRRLWERGVSKFMAFTSWATCGMIILMAYMTKMNYPIEDIYICFGVLIFCLCMMILGTVALFFQMVGDLHRFIKNKEWQNWKKREKKEK